MDLMPGSELTMNVLQKTFETNIFGVFRVTKVMLPRPLVSGNGFSEINREIVSGIARQPELLPWGAL